VLERNLQGFGRNESVQPHWIGDSGRFWYQRDGSDGPEFIVVTAVGAKAPAFDQAGLARALSEALGEPSSGKSLPVSLTHGRLSDDLTHLTGQIDKRVPRPALLSRCGATSNPSIGGASIGDAAPGVLL
jgi:dipeptidyl-peptidase 4